jgi:gas vesicle protein
MALLRFAIPAAVGAALAYFFDPDRGKGRRTQLVDRTMSQFRSTGRKAERLGRRVTSDVQGLKQKATHGGVDRMPENDETLRDKVRSEVLRDFPTDRVVVNVVDGVVELRGEVDQPEIIRDLESRIADVSGVRGVANMLHLPGAPAPNK